MRRLLTLAFIFCLMAVSASGRTARGIDPKADSIAVVRMREKIELGGDMEVVGTIHAVFFEKK